MIGNVKSEASIIGIVKESGSIVGNLSTSSILAGVDAGKIEIIHSDLPDYEGSYIAVPSGEEQTFSMINMTARQDFVVEAIPYTTYPNSAGGLTAVIGSGEG